MKNIIYIILFLLLPIIVLAQELDLKISLEKEVYYEGECVNLLVSLINTTNHPYEISQTINASTFIIKDSQNNILKSPYGGLWIDPIHYNYTLNINEEILEVIRISRVYGNKNLPRLFANTFSYGEYSVQVRYEDYLIEGRRDTVRHKTYVSNIINFKVLPLEDKDEIMMKRFIELYEKRFELGNDNFKNELLAFIINNENSPLLSTMTQYLRFYYDDKADEELIALILRHPNSYWCSHYQSLIKDLNLNNLKDYDAKFKGSFLERTIINVKQSLREYEKRKTIDNY